MSDRSPDAPDDPDLDLDQPPGPVPDDDDVTAADVEPDLGDFEGNLNA